MLVHITFEKITGLPGTFEGEFICDNRLEKNMLLIFNSFLADSTFVFTQDGKYIFMRSVTPTASLNYLEHFYYGVNFLITELSGGITAGHKPSPN